MPKDQYGAAIVCIDECGRILLVRETEANPNYYKYLKQWSIPMGHKERGESAEECIQRECLEEMGRKLDGPIFWVGVFSFRMLDGCFATLDVFMGRANGPLEGCEVSEVKEVTKEEIEGVLAGKLRYPSLSIVRMVLNWIKSSHATAAA